MRQVIKEHAFLRRMYYRMQGARSQSDEVEIIEHLAAEAPRSFIEFGFHPAQFNCIRLANNPKWRGLLIDGNEQQVDDARAIFSSRHKIVREFLTLDKLDFIRSSFNAVGVLSIDVDGNDYWFLEALIDIGPTVISVEYNSTFGFEPISVPYDPYFDRHKMHPRGWYHGASLAALATLCSKHGYGLAAVSESGVNAFFTKDGTLDPRKAWKPCKFRETLSGCSHKKQWEEVKNFPFVVLK